jgi:opacity protein-like surface antigen
MTNHRLVVVALVCAMIAVPASARAQEGSAPATSGATPEITPYVFLGSLASSGVGVAFRWPLPAHLSLELETSYRRSEVSPVNANFNLLFDFPEIGRVTPYVVAGVGLDQYAFADLSPRGTIVAQAKTGFSVNAGAGLRVRTDENWGIRTDARWLNGIGDRAPERWRLYNGVTFGRKGR